MPPATNPPLRRKSARTDQEKFLIGATGLSHFIQSVKKVALDGHRLDSGDLAAQWRAAARVYQELQTSEAGVAESIEVLPLPRVIQKHVDVLLKQKHFEHSFQSIPIAFGMVELSKLVACQYDVTVSKVKSLRKILKKPVSDELLANICLPLANPTGDFKLAFERQGEFIFHAPTHDFRYLGARMLDPAQIKSLDIDGFPAAVVALAVGFSTNVLNVLRYGKRMVLNNGYHRVNALMAQGVTHAPCVIKVCEHWEDVCMGGMSEIADNGTLYFTNARPPLLRDYMDRRLVRSFDAARLRRQVSLKFQYDSIQLSE